MSDLSFWLVGTSAFQCFLFFVLVHSCFFICLFVYLDFVCFPYLGHDVVNNTGKKYRA